MPDTPPKKYCSPSTVTAILSQITDPRADDLSPIFVPDNITLADLSPQLKLKFENETPSQKELTLTDTLNLSIQSVSDVITLLESLPRVGGKLPDKIVLAIGKLNGALNFLRK